MKILLLGKHGLLGSALAQTLAAKHNIAAFGHDELDITNEKKVIEAVSKTNPEIAINAAGYTAVDKAETEKELALKVNAHGPKFLAQACEQRKITLVHFSTDYIFDGKNSAGYKETDAPSPLSVYGASKAEGEKNILENCTRVFLIRTSWLFGPS